MRALNIAATGMGAQQLNVEVISNNIANMNTVGFKKQRADFQDLLYQNLRQVGSNSADAGNLVPTGVQIGSHAYAEETAPGTPYTVAVTVTHDLLAPVGPVTAATIKVVDAPLTNLVATTAPLIVVAPIRYGRHLPEADRLVAKPFRLQARTCLPANRKASVATHCRYP